MGRGPVWRLTELRGDRGCYNNQNSHFMCMVVSKNKLNKMSRRERGDGAAGMTAKPFVFFILF